MERLVIPREGDRSGTSVSQTPWPPVNGGFPLNLNRFGKSAVGYTSASQQRIQIRPLSFDKTKLKMAPGI